MDDLGDRGYSRAPELEDLVSLCKALNADRRLKRAMADEIVVDLMRSACGVL